MNFFYHEDPAVMSASRETPCICVCMYKSPVLSLLPLPAFHLHKIWIHYFSP